MSIMRLDTQDAYRYIAFITGFALMAYELVASRILAPTIGSSIYVWTSVIGVILAALSAGFAVGGKVADRRVEPLDVNWLLLISAISVVLTLVNAPLALNAAVLMTTDPRIQGFFASLLLFAPTSFILGTISPYLSRLKNASVRTTGTTVASLSAHNAVGGIAGTFITGFVFFAYIGSREALLLISLILFSSSWLVQPRQNAERRITLTVLYAILFILSLTIAEARGVAASIETPSATYKVIDTEHQGRQIRALRTGPYGMQSAIYRDGEGLVFTYTQKMAELVAKAPSKDAVLILGGGAFTLPEYLATKHPSSKIDVVEIDEQLPAIAERYFGYDTKPNISVISQDARTFLNDNDKQYDIILVDVYSDTAIPFSLATEEYAGLLRRALKQGGIVAANIIGANNHNCGLLLGALDGSYRSGFSGSVIYPTVTDDVSQYQNFIFVYHDGSVNWLPTGRNLRLDKSVRLTDDFAPIENLRSQCTRAG